jgi:hypothetical protein
LGDEVDQAGGEPAFRDAVLDFDALDDLSQLVFSLLSPPCFRGALTSLNTMSLAVFADRAPFVRKVR